MAENLVICIARQFGSGGHEIGLALAKEMGIPFYDKELLKEAADKSGILQELFEKSDEKPSSSLFYASAGIDGQAKRANFADYVSYAPSERMQGVITDVIRDAAAASSCVIIGRCADYVLRGRARTLSAFIWAGMEQRVQRIAQMHKLDEDAARALVRKTDRNRANYYRFSTDRDWNAIDNYDVAIHAGRLGNEGSVALLQKAAELFCPGGI